MCISAKFHGQLIFQMFCAAMKMTRRREPEAVERGTMARSVQIRDIFVIHLVMICIIPLSGKGQKF